jgi:hypothetical protein
LRLKPLYRQILCYETRKVRMAEFSFLPADKGNEMQCAEPNVHYPPESIWGDEIWQQKSVRNSVLCY